MRCRGHAAGAATEAGALTALEQKAAFPVQVVCPAARGSVLIIAHPPLPSMRRQYSCLQRPAVSLMGPALVCPALLVRGRAPLSKMPWGRRWCEAVVLRGRVYLVEIRVPTVGFVAGSLH